MSRVAVLLTLAALSVITARAAALAQTPAVDRYVLPAEVTFPEGIAHDPARGVIYTASALTGALVRVDLKTRQSEIVSPAGILVPAGSTTFPAALGMKLDGANRLWVAGGRTGRMLLIDVRTGRVLKQFEVPAPDQSLINDVALIGTTGYFTDTRSPTLWRVEARGDQIGDLQPWLRFDGTVLQHDSAGPNLNGIAAMPDGRSLIVVQMGKGLLFRIDVATKAVSAIDTASADLTGADGLVLDGRTLYIVRQPAAEIVTVALSDDLTKGTVTARFKDAQLAWPATAVKVDDRLLVVNTQFNTRASKSQTLPFTILSVPLSRLAPGR
jgi:Cu-Zn family superoxide dismutase